MTNLVIALAIASCIAAVWVSFEILMRQRRYSKMLRKRGITINELTNLRSQGTIVLDYVYGRSIGIGSPVVWFNDMSGIPAESVGGVLETSRLVDIPILGRTLDGLKRYFPGMTILESTTI